ncbi:Branched-chain amino acid transport ATP-binding protein LivG (TC 3.A.1.4.1) [Halanaerobium saccharolyticum subsp. saccharolyticum DSM 6643]|uniref:Branched-chain amino acid transport ATP-binding protein LivG (TC 3.A.1.4.1) n=1 Tax=Halanaerobium saccharolyticum subsp. saccharolyticum DSM 6643 TaxID=1293054 RepID=M5E2B1_9FIRM|nr:ABC transporter ATP-binding protein [Halanaerobium saccharolyticum]CCU79738.1 Branched-chain amino acid transport ATP-binding protein LivG (TC 3.A.1.4.1) [Halanaerobium saccharolyticum subsp. saccharolyticum DSM 6643]
MLKVKSVVKEFSGFRAVDECSFEVEKNTITGLIGPNGAGKTTMFNLIAGSLKLDQGEVYFSEQKVNNFAPHQIARLGLARTFQIPKTLRKMTVLENLMLVPSGQSGENIWNSWFRGAKVENEEKVNAAKAYETLEFLEMEHLADEMAVNLSGGQKKLLELGRALMAEPELILLDEPGAGVNPTLLNKIAENILKLKERGKTILLIEHNMDLIMNICDRVIVMNDGKHLVEGTPAEIKTNPQVLEAYLGEKTA